MQIQYEVHILTSGQDCSNLAEIISQKASDLKVSCIVLARHDKSKLQVGWSWSFLQGSPPSMCHIMLNCSLLCWACIWTGSMPLASIAGAINWMPIIYTCTDPKMHACVCYFHCKSLQRVDDFYCTKLSNISKGPMCAGIVAGFSARDNLAADENPNLHHPGPRRWLTSGSAHPD